MPFSNTNTNNNTTVNRNADPYTENSHEDLDLGDRIIDLRKFVTRTKFCMMATRAPSGLLASRCMSLAAHVSPTLQGCEASDDSFELTRLEC